MFGKNKAWLAAALAGGLVALGALVGCEREPSVASKSAAAFREAQEKGETFESGAQGHGHGAVTPGEEHEMQMPGTAPESGSAAGHSGMAMEDMDHSGMAMGGTDQAGKAQGMDHSGMAMGGTGQAGKAQGMDHSGMAMGGVDPAEPAAVAVSPGQPASTLRPGPLDAPAATSVLDAQRSAEMAEGMAGGGHGAHGVARYRHVDAGRGPGAYEGSEKQTPGAGPHQHESATPPPSGHEGEHPQEPPGAAANEEAAVYACPMHPEITSNAPGKCPKCGMTLVERRKG
jgi:hypothetical protein